jgi:protein transport protein SEC61 subunit gamma-like protein
MNLLSSIKSFMLKCVRVWRVTRKPTLEEFKTIAKVSAIGIIVIGFIGFAVSLIMNLLIK